MDLGFVTAALGLGVLALILVEFSVIDPIDAIALGLGVLALILVFFSAMDAVDARRRRRRIAK